MKRFYEMKWFWGVVILIFIIAAATALLILGKFPSGLSWDRIAIGGGAVMSYFLGRKDGAKA